MYLQFGINIILGGYLISIIMHCIFKGYIIRLANCGPFHAKFPILPWAVGGQICRKKGAIADLAIVLKGCGF